LKDDKPVGTPSALLLLKVLARDGIRPEPNFSERLEAAIGLCQLPSRGLTNYQQDYAAQFVGKFIVEFLIEHGNDTDKKLRGWKSDSLRLDEALNTLKNDSNKDKFAADLQGKADPLLKHCQNVQKSLAPQKLNDFSSWLENYAK